MTDRITSLPIFNPAPPYQFAKVCDIWRRWAYPSLHYSDGTMAWRTLSTEDGSALVAIRADGQITVTDHTGQPNPQRLRSRLGRILGEHDDQQAFFAALVDHPQAGPLLAPLVGLPILRMETAYEALVITIIEQHIAWVNAQRSVQMLAQMGGTLLAGGPVPLYTLPRPAWLARQTPEALRALRITQGRCALLISLAQHIEDGSLDLDNLAEEGATTFYDHLLALKGIGPWTAANVVGRTLGVFLHVMDNDVALQRAVGCYFLGRDGRASLAEMRDVFAPFGAHAGLLAHHTLNRWVLDRYPPSLAGLS